MRIYAEKPGSAQRNNAIKNPPHHDPPSPTNDSTTQAMLDLQSTVGNQFVLRMLRSRGGIQGGIIRRDEHGGGTQQGSGQQHKTLKDEKVDVQDPVFSGTAEIVDRVLGRNQKLAPYIGDKVSGGLKIAEKGKFKQELSDGNFDNAFSNAYNGATAPKDVVGFFDPATMEIHLRPNTKFGTALHESVHKLAAAQFYKVLPIVQGVSQELLEVLKEGVTAYFTDVILEEEKLPKHKDGYASYKEKAENIITSLGSNGFDLIAKFNFKTGSVRDIGKALGVDDKQYIEFAKQHKETTEILKKIKALI